MLVLILGLLLTAVLFASCCTAVSDGDCLNGLATVALFFAALFVYPACTGHKPRIGCALVTNNAAYRHSSLFVAPYTVAQ